MGDRAALIQTERGRSRRLTQDRSQRAAIAVVGAGVGVAIGRFQRWNSWDLITQPGLVAHGTLDWARSPNTDIQPTGVALAVTAFFGLAYLTIWALSSPQVATSAQDEATP